MSEPLHLELTANSGRDVLLVRGRMFNVATRHLMSAVDDIVEGAIKQTVAIHGTDNAEGDVLVFMPGAYLRCNNCQAKDIQGPTRLSAVARDSDGSPTSYPRVWTRLALTLGVPPSTAEVSQLQILPLYATLPPAAQAKIFAPTPPNTRRVIVATNIAETSITIPGVSYVVDTGFKKEKRFIPGAKGGRPHRFPRCPANQIRSNRAPCQTADQPGCCVAEDRSSG